MFHHVNKILDNIFCVKKAGTCNCRQTTDSLIAMFLRKNQKIPILVFEYDGA
jgi:hypothetical protein